MMSARASCPFHLVVYLAQANADTYFVNAIAVYATANLSGGHITPTVTIATMITGHIGLLKGVAYVISQLVGGIFASLLIVRLLPSSN